MKIDITKKYRTNDAKWPVTIVSVNGPYPGFPVVGYAHSSSAPLLSHWAEDGGYPANTRLDLIEIREPREFRLWVNERGNTALPLRAGDKLPQRSIDAGWSEIRVREIL